MANNLVYLSIIFDRPDWKELAEKNIRSLSSAITKYPTSFGVWASVLQVMVIGTMEIVIAGKDASDHLFPVLNLYLPNKLIQSTQLDQPQFPLLKGKFKPENSGFFLCKDYVCDEPIFELEKLLQICNS